MFYKYSTSRNDSEKARKIVELQCHELRKMRSVSIRCQGYIGDFVLGWHAKDMVVLAIQVEAREVMLGCHLATRKHFKSGLVECHTDDNVELPDYALWEVIEYGNSFKPVAKTTTNADGSSTSTIPGPVTTEEKTQNKNDVKARSMLPMALPNEHQLTFSQYKDAKTLFEAIQARFGRNEATKKTQMTLLKQMYENFSASSQDSLDSISNRLQKIVSQLAILGENISQEDLKFKFLRSLPSEWSMHVVVWRNKPDLVNTASTNVSTASTNDSTSTLSDATIYAFLDNQPNGSQVVHEDLEQIHEDDLEEIYLKWQLALLSLKERKFYQRTGKKIIINGSDTAGYDKSKVKCFNCHKMGHFAREYKGHRNQESRSRNQESSKRIVNMEDTTSKAMVAFDGEGFDWSFMANEEVPTNLALMAFSDSEVYNYKTCSDTCLKSYETLKSQYNSLRVELNKSDFDLATYKRGIAFVEEQLVFYKKNEVMLCDQIAVLKRDASFRDSEINALNIQIEKLKKDKESNQIKIDKSENASKSLDKLIGVKFLITIEKEFPLPEFEGYGVNVNKSVSENSSNKNKRNTSAPIIEDWVSDCDEDECEEMISDNVQHKSEPKPEQAKQPRKINQNPRNNRTNWNEKKTQKLGVWFQFTKKACFVCGSFNHLIKDCDFHDKKMVQKPVLNNVKQGTGQREVRPVWNNAMRTNHQNFSNSRRNFAPTVVLTKSGLVPISAARQSSSRTTATVSTARPIKTAAPKPFGDPQVALKDIRIFDSGCSRNMTGNKSFLTDYQDYDGGYVAFVGSYKGVSHKCVTRKNSVLFTKTECLILSPDFKLPVENQLMLKIPKKDNMYSFDLKNVVPSKGLTSLIAKATNDESNMWHRRLGHINFKTINKLVKGNLVRGLPSKIFENNHSCVACQKGKQHKASCKSKLVTSISQSLQILHMDLFGPTFVKSIMCKAYCLVVTDDYRKFSWVFFFAKKDKTSGILKNFITGIENQLNHKVKIIRCDNETEFKNYEMNQFCGIKGIKREFNSARTSQ
ncbi:putative ribonuclease H-like domain-containing protein [Tanacetum coccineum]